MDQLSPAEKAEVEGYLSTYPELRQDLLEIGGSLEVYAMSAARTAPTGLKDKILSDIRNEPAKPSSGPGSGSGKFFGGLSIIALVMGGLLLLSGNFWWQKNTENELLQRELTAARDTCEQTTQQLTAQLQILQQLTYPENQIIPFQATPGFASTDLYLHHNTSTQRNFIQVRNLPALSETQSYQLWSLKPGEAPEPLDVFNVPATGLLEVQFVEGTENYAITIEPRGGSETPTLVNLIGIVGVRG